MLEKRYNFKKAEETWMNYWQEKEIYKFNLEENKKIFSIDTPPPTVSGKIHIGHIFSYTQAEIIARYHRITGRNVFYPFGFDDNGLPTERLVEKENNIKAKELNRNDFIKLCLETTKKYEKEFENLFKRIGVSADWSLKYNSINDISRRISQRSFIELAKNNHAYYSTDPTTWCTECETSIAQAELENKNLDSTFNYLKFEIEKEESIEIATTRPEFLHSCVAIFVHPDDEKSKHLIGKEAIVPLYRHQVPILADEKVELGKGSGKVMCCTFGDATDIEWWKKYKLPFKELFDNEGKILGDIKFIGGKKIKEARETIINLLKEKELIIKTESIRHDVSVHERCGNEIEFKVKNGWFIKTLDIKEELIEYGKKIKWHPKHMQARYIDWVENLVWDWSISRQRFYGVPFPVWYCKDCGNTFFAEDKDLPIDPTIDSPKNPCEKCGSTEYIAETDVMDTWATSSTTQLLNMKWGEEDSLVEKMSPMSLRPNAHDIIRTWDFYSIVKNYYHLNEIPWENVMISGFVMADKEEKISKRKDNAKTEPIEIINEYSADVIRYWAASGKLGSDIQYKEDTLKIGTKVLNKLWNVSKFITMQLEDYKLEEVEYEPIDEWMVKKLDETLNKYKEYLDKYEIGLGMGAIEKFFWNFCDNYIEITKHRLYRPEDFGAKERKSGQKAIYEILFKLIQAFSIYFPFITEEIYQNFFKKYKLEDSIHKIELKNNKANIKNDTSGEVLFEIVSKVRGLKTNVNVSLKTKVINMSITINSKHKNFMESSKKDLIAATNTESLNIEYSDNIGTSIINSMELETSKQKAVEQKDNSKEVKALRENIARREALLNNAGYKGNAPKELVESEKERLEEEKERLETLES